MRGGVAIIVSMLALAAVAVAQDACLSGASTFGDHRVLAALRTAVDASCKCASFTGALRRRHYAACVRSQIAAALHAGTLHGECDSSAQALYRDATCGTNRVTYEKDEAHAIVQRWVIPFVLRYLKGDTRFDPFFDVVPPGVVVDQDRSGS